jgi:hypothetical protein
MNADGSCEMRLTRRTSTGPRFGAPAWQPAPSSGPRLECVDVRVGDGGPETRPGTEPFVVGSPAGALMGARVRYRLEVESSGTRRATDVTLRLARTQILVPASAHAQGGTCELRPVLVCRFGTLPAGAQRAVVIDLLVSPAAVERRVGSRLALLGDLVRFSAAAREPEEQTLDNVLRFTQNIWACTIRGTHEADRLRGTPGRDRICGAPGNDMIHALGGDDVIDGGAGADVIFPGPGRDVVRGGPGNDTIHAADGERDVISCGPGRDRVVADRIDLVGRDCERVVRR